jgi:hypothetical protein
MTQTFRLALCAVIATWALVGNAMAQCANSVHLSCDVYNSCFAKYCNCQGGPNEYFLTYGRKYCDRFLGSTGWSAAGDKWRDTTLRCLQESIVPKLDIGDHPHCDCKAMKEYAFKTHVTCYTKTGASVCSLTLGDFRKIAQIIDLTDDLFKDPYGRAQARQVLEICRSDQNSTIPASVLDVIVAILNRIGS